MHDEEQERGIVEQPDERDVAKQVERGDDERGCEPSEHLRPQRDADVAKQREQARQFRAERGEKTEGVHTRVLPIRSGFVSTAAPRDWSGRGALSFPVSAGTRRF